MALSHPALALPSGPPQWECSEVFPTGSSKFVLTPLPNNGVVLKDAGWKGTAGMMGDTYTAFFKNVGSMGDVIFVMVSLTDTSSPAKWSMLRFSF
jgi:hypothetical protein